eukprot:gene3435-1809_t
MAAVKICLMLVVTFTVLLSVRGKTPKQELIGRFLWFRSLNFRQYFIRHKNFLVHIERRQHTKRFLLDSLWKIVPGLCGRGISFQAYTNKNYYLRHRNYLVRLDKYENTRGFKNDACFIARHGLADPKLYSFVAVNPKGYVLRHQGFRMKISRNDGTLSLKQDATFDHFP